jgi:hypothetical protein
MCQRRGPSRTASCKHADAAILPDDLFDYAQPRTPRRGRPPKCELGAWTVTDDWPERVPVTLAEVEVFEAWFGDLVDELFGPEE